MVFIISVGASVGAVGSCSWGCERRQLPTCMEYGGKQPLRPVGGKEERPMSTGSPVSNSTPKTEDHLSHPTWDDDSWSDVIRENKKMGSKIS